MKKSVFAACVFAVLAASEASAQGFVGGGLGQGKVNLDCTGTVACDTSASTGKLFAGYRFGNSLGVELAVVNFGKAKGAVVFNGVRVNLDIEHQSVALALSSDLALSPNWSLISRLGIASNKGSAKGSAGGISATENKTSVAPYASIGVAYAVTPSTSIEGAFDATTFKDPSSDRYGAYFAGIAVKFSF